MEFKEDNNEYKWYILKVRSGSEKSVKNAIEIEFEKENISHMLKDIKLPVIQFETVDKKKLVDQKLFAGYFLMNLILDENSHNIIRRMANVFGFEKNSDGNVAVISESEVKKHFNTIESNKDQITSQHQYFIGKRIIVIQGPFHSSYGIISDIYESKVKVLITMLGKTIAIDLAFNQIKKA